MKLKKIGELYKTNLENKFISSKDKDISQLLINLINVSLDYVKLEINHESLHSIYLRGSCLKRDVTDKSISDLDIDVVLHDNSFKYYAMNDGYKEKIIDKMNKLYGFSLYPDVVYYSKSYWSSHIESCIFRFQAKKIEGIEDLSITSLDIDEVILYQQKLMKRVYDQYFSRPWNRNFYSNTLIKRFYRICGGLELLKNGRFSLDIYYCYTALVEKYPQHSDLLEELVRLYFTNCHVFSLNPEEYDNLNKFEETMRSILETSRIEWNIIFGFIL